MNGFAAFTKKEFVEQLRSYKILIIIATLFLFGMSSPLLAKMTPDILSHMSVQGVKIVIPEPTALDAWAQFFKNMSSMGLVVMLLVYAGTLSQELAKGTLVLPLSKGLSRSAVIGAKFFAAVTSWTVGYVIAVLTACGYTQYLFGGFNEPRLFLSLLCLWLFGVFIIAVILLASVITAASYGGLLLTALFLGTLLLINVLPKLQKWNPATIASNNSLILTNEKAAGDMWTALIVTAVLTAVCLTLSLILFKKKKL